MRSPDESMQGLSDRIAGTLIAGVSVAVTGFLMWLVYGNAPGSASPSWSRVLPTANALFNAASACCLVLAVRAARRRRFRRHVALVGAALSCSALFLVSYVLHHAWHGDTKFAGQGVVRPFYFFILISHILLSVAVLPMVLTTVFLAVTSRFPRHRRLARWTFPVWLYVSSTGVLVFLLLLGSR